MLGNWAHEGLQPPSNLEERKGLKETQHAAHVCSAARPHPPRTHGVISASLEGSRPKPSTAPHTSASLEGSEPILEKADRLRLKELSSRTPGVRLHLTGPTVPDPLPARGRVRCHHESQRWKCSAPMATDPDPRRWVRDLHMPSGLPQMGPGPPRAYPDPRELSAQLAAREGSGTATCHADAGVGTSLPLKAPSPTRITCEWWRRALLPLGRAAPRQKGQMALPLTCPPYGGINANHSSTAPGSGDVRPPFPTVAVTRVPSANSGHCSPAL
jgi:hypothetical protein